jgi:prolyl oligopeptidase
MKACFSSEAIRLLKMLREIQLPAVGTAGGFGGKKKDKTLYYSLLITQRQNIYSFDPNVGKSAVYEKPKVDFKSDDYESKQVFYTSKDGTKFNDYHL